MNDDNDVHILRMAYEKLVAMLYTIDHTMDFLDEYHVKPDMESRKEVTNAIEQMRKWVDGKRI